MIEEENTTDIKLEVQELHVSLAEIFDRWTQIKTEDDKDGEVSPR